MPELSMHSLTLLYYSVVPLYHNNTANNTANNVNIPSIYILNAQYMPIQVIICEKYFKISPLDPLFTSLVSLSRSLSLSLTGLSLSLSLSLSLPVSLISRSLSLSLSNSLPLSRSLASRLFWNNSFIYYWTHLSFGSPRFGFV